ncbi:hypothetical protein PM082_008583 [Marasmius tenuissimus]|nr:hypothetical protein PM082_008583 [Marasmius tenuissimus]
MAGVFTTSFAEYESRVKVISPSLLKRITNWLVDTSLFEEAWKKACTGSVNWWWSEQICTYVAGPWTVFLFVQAQRYRIKHLWAYMLLGQLVAISVASNLFYLALILSGWQFRTLKRQPSTAPPVLWASVLLSLVTVANSPYTTDSSFLLNLLIMHALLIIPLFFTNREGQYSSQLNLSYSALSMVLYVFILVLRVKTTLAGIRSVTDSSLWQGLTPFCKSVLTVLHSHPAQASIGWDVIWTSISFAIWTCLDQGFSIVPFSALLVSAGVVAPWFAASRAELEEMEQATKTE